MSGERDLVRTVMAIYDSLTPEQQDAMFDQMKTRYREVAAARSQGHLSDQPKKGRTAQKR